MSQYRQSKKEQNQSMNTAGATALGIVLLYVVYVCLFVKREVGESDGANTTAPP